MRGLRFPAAGLDSRCQTGTMRLASTGGAPVWTDKANPVASSWIEACQNLDGKKAGLFMTCRFRAGGSPEALPKQVVLFLYMTTPSPLVRR